MNQKPTEKDMPSKKENPIQQPKKAPHDWKVWEDYLVKLQQEAPNRIEAGAKQLTALITLSMSIFGALGLKNLEEIPSNSMLLIKMGLVLWLISAVIALWVAIPKRYPTIPNNTQAVKESLEKIVKTKSQRLNISVVIFGLGLICLVVGFFINT